MVTNFQISFYYYFRSDVIANPRPDWTSRYFSHLELAMSSQKFFFFRILFILDAKMDMILLKTLLQVVFRKFLLAPLSCSLIGLVGLCKIRLIWKLTRAAENDDSVVFVNWFIWSEDRANIKWFISIGRDCVSTIWIEKKNRRINRHFRSSLGQFSN